MTTIFWWVTCVINISHNCCKSYDTITDIVLKKLNKQTKHQTPKVCRNRIIEDRLCLFLKQNGEHIWLPSSVTNTHEVYYPVTSYCVSICYRYSAPVSLRCSLITDLSMLSVYLAAVILSNAFNTFVLFCPMNTEIPQIKRLLLDKAYPTWSVVKIQHVKSEIYIQQSWMYQWL